MSRATASSTPHDSTCPRCGYDLRGVIATWADACPLTGTCSECGLELEWARVILPDKFVPTKCVEYAPFKMKAWIRACIWTTFRVLLPWLLWRRVKMWHPPRLRRIVGLIFILIAMLQVGTYFYVQVSNAAIVRSRMERFVADSRSREEMAIAHYTAQRADVESGLWDGRWVFAGMPIPENATERDRAPTIRFINQSIAGHEAKLQSGYYVDCSYLTAIAEAVLLPWSDTSSGQLMLGGAVSPYPAPREIHWIHAVWRVDRLESRSNLEILLGPGDLIISAALLLALAVVYPWTLLLLVQTRRRTKLRIVHLARMGLYGIAGIVMLAAVPVPLVQTQAVLPVRGWVDTESWAMSLLASGVIWLLLWWWIALRWYARIPHAFIVAFIHMILTCTLIPILPLAVVALLESVSGPNF